MEEKKENTLKSKKEILINLILTILIITYFMVMNFLYASVGEIEIVSIMKIASFIILILSIAIFEIAYHKDNGKIAINGIEILVIAIQSLTSWTIAKRLKIGLNTYILFSTYTFTIYYILKSIIIYTIDKKKYLDSLSDIHEIVSKEPVKKEAKKRKKA